MEGSILYCCAVFILLGIAIASGCLVVWILGIFERRQAKEKFDFQFRERVSNIEDLIIKLNNKMTDFQDFSKIERLVYEHVEHISMLERAVGKLQKIKKKEG